MRKSILAILSFIVILMILASVFLFITLPQPQLFSYVVQIETPQKIREAIQIGANIHDTSKTGETSLILASAYNNNPEVISILLKTGAKINTPDTSGQTPLMHALLGNSNPEIITLLLNAGADPKLKNKRGMIALDYAKRNKDINGTEVYKRLEKASQ